MAYHLRAKVRLLGSGCSVLFRAYENLNYKPEPCQCKFPWSAGTTKLDLRVSLCSQMDKRGFKNIPGNTPKAPRFSTNNRKTRKYSNKKFPGPSEVIEFRRVLPTVRYSISLIIRVDTLIPKPKKCNQFLQAGPAPGTRAWDEWVQRDAPRQREPGLLLSLPP